MIDVFFTIPDDQAVKGGGLKIGRMRYSLADYSTTLSHTCSGSKMVEGAAIKIAMESFHPKDSLPALKNNNTKVCTGMQLTNDDTAAGPGWGSAHNRVGRASLFCDWVRSKRTPIKISCFGLPLPSAPGVAVRPCGASPQRSTAATVARRGGGL